MPPEDGGRSQGPDDISTTEKNKGGGTPESLGGEVAEQKQEIFSMHNIKASVLTLFPAPLNVDTYHCRRWKDNIKGVIDDFLRPTLARSRHTSDIDAQVAHFAAAAKEGQAVLDAKLLSMAEKITQASRPHKS